MGLFSRSNEQESARFDRATLELPSGETRQLTPREFEELPLDERVRSILGKKLKFFRDGREIPVKDAIGQAR